jgi:hypothetical protein
MAFGDNDLPMLVGGLFSVAVSFGATTTRGISTTTTSQFDEDGSARVVGRSRGVTVQTSLVGHAHATAPRSPSTARLRVVRGQPMALEDGATSLVYLRG